MEIKVKEKTLPGTIFMDTSGVVKETSFVPKIGTTYTAVTPFVLGDHPINPGNTVVPITRNSRVSIYRV